MKKIYSILLILSYCIMPALALSDVSENGFEILIDETPNPSSYHKSHGLSDGAITAIALGSTFGGLLLAGGVIAKYTHDKLICTRVLGQDKGYLPICYNDSLLDKIQNEYGYELLTRAIKEQNLKDDCSIRYIFVQDSELEHNTYNRIYLDLTTKSKIRIIQYSTDNNIQSFLFNGDKEINLSEEFNENNILIKSGEFLSKSNGRTFIDTINKSKNSSKYALIIAVEEF